MDGKNFFGIFFSIFHVTSDVTLLCLKLKAKTLAEHSLGLIAVGLILYLSLQLPRKILINSSCTETFCYWFTWSINQKNVPRHCFLLFCANLRSTLSSFAKIFNNSEKIIQPFWKRSMPLGILPFFPRYENLFFMLLINVHLWKFIKTSIKKHYHFF